ncbi:MAG: hypothetical protein JSV85_05350 [Candidatus Bathyarchaeota archaeon]|nr:MAG: hypothetical protein JSV85_05350 [Candidatus Bathyarchaeota archaeon]
MSTDPYADALKNTLTEIKNVCPEINSSFIFTKEGTIVAGDTETADTTITKTLSSFQSLTEKADIIGGLHNFSVDGDKGKVHISRINDIYLATATSRNADENYLRSVTQVIVPTVLKLLESLVTTPLKSTQPQQLLVETFSGFFAGDAVQVDPSLLTKWSELYGGKRVSTIEVETFGGETTQCKVKEINDPNLRRKGIIRMPERVCKTLEVNKGEPVKIKPVEP